MQTELDGFDIFAFDKLGKAMAFFLPKPSEWSSCDAILSYLVDSKEADEKELFGKASFDSMDILELNETFADKENTVIMLPGITMWSATESEAQAIGPNSATEVTITLKKAKAFDFEGKSLINRIACKVTEWSEENKKATFEFCDDLKFENLGAAATYFGAAAEVKEPTEGDKNKPAAEEGKE